MTQSLKTIEVISKKMMEKFKGETYWFPTFGSSENDAIQDGTPLIVETISGVYSYIIIEKGSTLDKKSTDNPDELLYWIFKDITFSIADRFSARIGNNGINDNRPILFQKHIELLENLNLKQEFIQNLKREYNELLGTKLFTF